jgi:hypothetical protein
MEWVQLAQDVGQNRAVMSIVMKLWVSYKAGNFVTDERGFPCFFLGCKANARV